MVFKLVAVRVSRDEGKEVVPNSTLVLVDTRIAVSVEEIKEMREPRLVLEASASVTVVVTLFVLMATPLLETGVPLLQTTPLSF